MKTLRARDTTVPLGDAATQHGTSIMETFFKAAMGQRLMKFMISLLLPRCFNWSFAEDNAFT